MNSVLAAKVMDKEIPSHRRKRSIDARTQTQINSASISWKLCPFTNREWALTNCLLESVHFSFSVIQWKSFFDIKYMFTRVEYNLKRCLIQIHSSHRFRYSRRRVEWFLYGFEYENYSLEALFPSRLLLRSQK